MRLALRHRRVSLAAAITGGLLLVLALAACGGGEREGGSAKAVATSSPVAVAANDAGLVALDRFHYVATLTLREQAGPGVLTITTEGDFQQPDRHSFAYVTERDGSELKRAVVLIGDDAWFRDARGDWQAAAASDPEIAGVLEVAFSTARARFLGGAELVRVRDSVRTLPSTVETVNGVSADHYSVGEPGREYFESFVAADGLLEGVQDYTWDLWLATDGRWPVRLQASATIIADVPFLQALDLAPPATYELSIDVSHPDDPAIEITLPIG